MVFMSRDDKGYSSTNWKLWAGLIISALFLFLAFREVDIPRTWDLIRTANFLFLTLAAIATFMQFVVRAWRWRIYLRPLKKTGFLNRLLPILIGFAANCVLPARLGEFIRATYIGRREEIIGSSAFATIVIERIFDGFTLLFIFVIGLMATTFPDKLRDLSGSLRATALILFLAYILITVFIWGFKYKTDSFLRIINKLLFFLSQPLRSKTIRIIRNFSLGLVPIKGWRGWVLAIFYSFLVWALSLFQIQWVAYSIGIPIPFIATFIILTMGTFGVMIPSAPGFIGTFHLAAQYAFLFYGVTREEALSAAILWHASFFFPTILFGIVAFFIFQVQDNRLKEERNGYADRSLSVNNIEE